ncbi:MAG: protein kinase [Timaviella obliquedivisa GSE-PSE-MK23-08B]|jgi:serine/threonine-protein kinase|nr:protein kinase [Timaviella obliquedivisa GSE-PSE-MK23-08B]
MQPPIDAGTVLQNRYRVLSVLGQGGFGRTYLAEDKGRFDERCALKEFIPPQTSAYALSKSQELFQREAAILYQIQHPQIPQFRATFEEEERLFLVQDYVEGKTYRSLMLERKALGKTFSEPEVIQFIQQLLPVLAHIHSKGIIHRDIATDNVILRERDRLPVLIDFGVVKEIATRIQSVESGAQPTTVGKVGYAPSEQMQTGRAYPSSDLYALAVSAMVLLTGREPQELYDDRNLTWQWQRWATISPGFAQVLSRMLSYRPGDRYQSVNEVAQALQALNPATGYAPGATMPPSPPSVLTPQPPPASEMRTMAVGRPAETRQTGMDEGGRSREIARRQPSPVIPRQTESSVWDNPLAVISIGTGLAVITGIASWAVVSAVLSSQNDAPTPIVSVTPTPTPTATPTPTPTPTTIEPISRQIDLPPTGEAIAVEGNLREKESINYIIPAQQGDTLTASLEGEGVLMTVFAPTRDPANNQATRVPSWQGILDFTGNYVISLSPVQGVSESVFKLNMSLLAPTPTPTATPTPTPTSIETLPPDPPERQVITQSLDLQAGQPFEFSDESDQTKIQRYLINVQPGQVMKVEVKQGEVKLDVRSPSGELVDDARGLTNWEGQITEAGNYQIDVIADQRASFTLSVGIAALNP